MSLILKFPNKLVVMLGILSFLLVFSSSTFADILYLKSGHSLEGRVVEETEDAVTFEIEGGKINFRRSEIDRIEESEVTIQESSFRSDSKTESEDSIWQKISKPIASFFAQFSKDEEPSHGRGRSSGQQAERSVIELVGLLAVGTLVQLIVTAFAMKFFLLIFHHAVSYWEMLWFQVKLLFIGCLVSFMVVFGIGFVLGIVTQAEPEASWFFQILLFAVPYTITYYVLAQRDLSVGFVEAFLLAIVMSFSYFGTEMVLADIGLVFPGSLLQQLQSIAV